MQPVASRVVEYCRGGVPYESDELPMSTWQQSQVKREADDSIAVLFCVLQDPFLASWQFVGSVHVCGKECCSAHDTHFTGFQLNQLSGSSALTLL